MLPGNGLVRPGGKRHRGGTRAGGARGGGISLPGTFEGACAFVRSARFRDGPVRFAGPCGPCLTGRTPGRDARGHAARRGDGTVRFRTRAASTIAKSIAIDQLNVAMDCIRFPTTCRRRSHGPKAGTACVRTGQIAQSMRGDGDVRDALARGHAEDATARAIHLVTQVADARAWTGRESSFPRADSRRLGILQHVARKTVRQPCRIVRGSACRSENGRIGREGKMPARRSGIRRTLLKPGEAAGPVGPAITARLMAPGRITRRARRRAGRTPRCTRCDQSQSR